MGFLAICLTAIIAAVYLSLAWLTASIIHIATDAVGIDNLIVFWVTLAYVIVAFVIVAIALCYHYCGAERFSRLIYASVGTAMLLDMIILGAFFSFWLPFAGYSWYWPLGSTLVLAMVCVLFLVVFIYAESNLWAAFAHPPWMEEYSTAAIPAWKAESGVPMQGVHTVYAKSR
jgi:hypothetical protein